MLLASSHKRIAILRFSAVGDIILTSSAIDTLSKACPSAELIFVTKQGMVPLVEHDPRIHTVLALQPNESGLSFRKRLAALKPTHVLDLHGKARGYLLASIVPKQNRARIVKRSLYQSLSVRLRLATYTTTTEVCARYHAAIEQLLQTTLPRGVLSLPLAQQSKQRITKLFNDCGLSPEGLMAKRPLVGLAPGSLWKSKRWPVEHFIMLADQLIDSGHHVFVTGSPAESDLLAKICSAVSGVYNFGTAVSLADLPALIDRCDSFVANDSGPMHMARALMVPTFALFGSTQPKMFDFTGHHLFYTDQPCAPCSLYGVKTCPRGDFICMESIDPKTVAQAVIKQCSSAITRPHNQSSANPEDRNYSPLRVLPVCG